ncbi:MAG: anaerobic sulfatase maturase [Erysipelotrichaceae bacterium]|nr:anaerobic sulfatase maturase [Erysipelotrichaceae bacterium]MDY5252120.1 anaerobic sulfatase maturase [Erysipelotrichaceae bacterium]
MKRLSFLIKPASSLCNLGCKYCFYHDVSKHRLIKSNGIMKDDTMRVLIDKSLKQLDEDGQITYAFQGGEPTVAGLDFFKTFVSYVQKQKKPLQKVHYALQTNGYVINDQWAEFFKEHHFLVGVSLDGYKDNHDYFRLTTNDKPTFQQVMKAIKILKEYEVDFNILTVLSRQLAKHPEKLYKFYQKEDLRYIQLIPCLAGFDDEDDPFALTPQLFSSFYKRFYDLWLNELQSGFYRSIGLFDNIIPMLNDVPPTTCGLLGFCSLQLVVESDGSIYPCDFYVLDEFKGGNIREDELVDVMKAKKMQNFLEMPRTYSSKCATCPFVNICHGNCKRMSALYFAQDYCGYQDFLRHAIPSMQRIARSL